MLSDVFDELGTSLVLAGLVEVGSQHSLLHSLDDPDVCDERSDS